MGCFSTAAPNPSNVPPASTTSVAANLLGTQRIYRARFDGARGGGAFKLTLRLAATTRFRLDASDPFGRALWTLDVQGAQGAWRDVRAGTSCSLFERIELREFPLSSLALVALPRLLLGEVPFEAVGEGSPRPRDGAWSMTTASGGELRARFVAGTLATWTLEERGVPFAAYRVERGEAILSGLESGLQMRWREAVSEPLSTPLPPFEAAGGGACAATPIAGISTPSEEPE